MQALERAWTENWVPNILLLAAAPADVVTLGKSVTYSPNLGSSVCKIRELDLIAN